SAAMTTAIATDLARVWEGPAMGEGFSRAR
ncbi:MAG: hypothetical protein QOD99_2898, partial [Chthoniobacter sp.]|nr:hypothetical protein [Chthoniobacter sp.]